MKKLLIVLLLTGFAQIQPNIVQLTEEEKIVRDKIIAYELHDDLDKFLKASLSFSCDIGSSNPADNYDSDKKPECQKMLEFLKAYAQQIEDQEKQVLMFTKTGK